METTMKPILILAAALTVSGLTYVAWPKNGSNTLNKSDARVGNTALAEVLLPSALSQSAQIGKRAFEAKCVACHGVNAAGQVGVAPPLVHKIYEPSHHGDESFQRAVSLGVRAHHWPFGNMPAVEGLTRGDVVMVAAYIRELQRVNGIN
jgi:cytochrome c